MTDHEKVARVEKAVAQQDQRIQNAEKSVVVVETKTEQNEKNIDRVETQSINRFEMLIDRMDAGFNSLKSELKADIHRLENELKTDRRWFNGLIVTSVIGALAILWQILKHLEVIQNSP